MLFQEDGFLMINDNSFSYNFQPTKRMQAVQTPIIPVIGELIRENPETISLGQGVVNYGPPPEAIAEIEFFLADPGNHKYGMVQGIPPLLESIRNKLQRENRINLELGSRIVVTAGANMGFMNAILAITDPGDEIILQVPYYFNHDMAVAIADCKTVCVPTDENFQPQTDIIRKAITKCTRAIVTISPNNPTGAVYSPRVLSEINNICRETGIYHISDEAYEYFTYEGVKHFSPGSLPDSSSYTISLFSFSKAYGFASWRVGYMVAPEHLFLSLRKIQDTILICPAVISQWAAIGTLKAGPDYYRNKIELLAGVRKSVLEQLKSLGDLVTVPRAQGAFYFLIRVNTSLDAMDLVKELICKYKVAVIPGGTFGINQGCYLRVAYGALEKDTVNEGVGRLVRGLREITGR